MIRRILIATSLFTILVATAQQEANAGDPYAQYQVWSHNFAMDRPWHGGYQSMQYGQPTAMIVPPTAHMRTAYSWGVSQNLTYPIYHQFGRSANSPGAAGRGSFRNTPIHPSNTDQFGYYYVRGPW